MRRVGRRGTARTIVTSSRCVAASSAPRHVSSGLPLPVGLTWCGLARTTAGEKNWRRGKRTARMEARARTRLRITIASALTGGQVRPHCTASDVCARRFMTGRCWTFRQGLHQLRWHVQPHVWRQDWVVAGPLRHALGGRPGLCTYLQHHLCNCVASLTAPARAGGVCAVRARKEGEMIDTLLTKQLGFAFTSA